MTDIKATLSLKSGETKNFSHCCLDKAGKFNLSGLLKSSVQLQQELNSSLTALVEAEKTQNSNSKTCSGTHSF